jgi:hypothetical protein
MKNKAYILIAILLVLVSQVGSAHAQAVTIEADKSAYKGGDTVTLSGTVGPVQAGTPVVLQISNPIKAVYRLVQVPVAADGSWNYDFKIGGVLGTRGEYTAEAIYRGQQAETTFYFTARETRIAQMQAADLQIDGRGYDIGYMIDGGEVTNITADPDSTTLTVKIEQTENGTLTIELPRIVVDAKSDRGDDADYTVVIDGSETVFEEETSNGSRTLIIDLPAGAQTVEITGTTMVPEFGVIAALMLAVLMVAAVGVARLKGSALGLQSA